MGTANLYATFDLTSLSAGNWPLRQRSITLASGSNASGTPLPRGTLLGRKNVGTAVVAPAGAGGGGANTGNGSLTMDASTPALINAKPGVYTVKFTAATAFTVTGVYGDVLGNGAVATAFANQIKFNTAAGGTAFVAGDGFSITIPDLDKYIPSVATAVDGSQQPVAVLAADTDASIGDVPTVAYFEGEFAGEVMNIDASWTITTAEAALRKAGASIYIRTTGVLG